MYTPSYGGAPPYSMSRAIVPGRDVVHDGLGFWGALIPVATSLVGSAIGGDDGRMSVDEYYPPTQSGAQLCPGAYDVGEVSGLIDTLPQFEADVGRVVAMDPAFAPGGRYAVRNTRGRAAVLVNIAHGGRDCTNKPEDTQGHAAIALLDRMRAADAQRRSLAAQAQAAATSVVRPVGNVVQAVTQGPPVVAGVPNVALLAGAGVLAFLLIRRK